MTNHSIEYRPDIDGLRAVAVLLVIVFHVFPDSLRSGFVGVDVFFVISGFLITKILVVNWNDSEDKGFFPLIQAFYARRIKRIMPALLLVIAACLVVGTFILPAKDYIRLGENVVAAVLFVSNFYYRSELTYFNSLAIQQPLLNLWSLGVEEQFYIFYPILLLLLLRYLGGSRVLLKTIMFSLMVASFLVCLKIGSTSVDSAFYYPHTRFWELLIGALLVKELSPFTAPKRNWWIQAKSVGGAVCILCSAILIRPEDVYPGWWTLLPTVGAALLIAAGPTGIVNRVFCVRPFRFVGKLSYPLYLWHWPILSLAFSVADLSIRGRVAALVLMAVASYLTWRLVERPVQARSGSTVTASLLAGALVLGGAGAFIIYMKGFPSRFPDAASQLLGKSYDYANEYKASGCKPTLDAEGQEIAVACNAEPTDGAKLFLWGDSHAAHLYPGLARQQDSQGKGLFAISNYTSGSCPPGLSELSSRKEQCAHINENALRHMRSDVPDILVLAGHWFMYQEGSKVPLDLANLKAVVDEAKKLNVKKIVLVGPVPIWKGSLDKILLRRYLMRKEDPMPQRLSEGLEPSAAELDTRLGDMAREWGINYISPYKTLCNAAGCLTQLGQSLTTWDYGHLTTESSVYVVGKNIGQLKQ